MDYSYDTAPINYVLAKYLPNHLPSFIHRDKCLFFHLSPHYHKGLGKTIKVDTNDLDTSRLYVADHDHAQQIWNDTVDARFSGERSDIPLETSAKRYWQSLTKWEDFLDDPSVIDYPEVLYFARIPFQQLCIASDIHPVAAKGFAVWRESYEVKQYDCTYADVFTSDNQYFTASFTPYLDTWSLRSKNGIIHPEALSLFEQHFPHHQKESAWNEKGLTLTYTPELPTS